MDDLTVLPPSIWDPTTRLEPPEKTITIVSNVNTRGSSYQSNIRRLAGTRFNVTVHTCHLNNLSMNVINYTYIFTGLYALPSFIYTIGIAGKNKRSSIGLE